MCACKTLTDWQFSPSFRPIACFLRCCCAHTHTHTHAKRGLDRDLQQVVEILGPGPLKQGELSDAQREEAREKVAQAQAHFVSLLESTLMDRGA